MKPLKKWRQLTKWEKIFADDMTNKGLIYKIYKHPICLYRLNIKKQTTQRKKWAGGLSRQFSKWDIQITKKNMKRCLTMLIIREIQIKTTRYHVTQITSHQKKLQITDVGKDVEEKEQLYTVGENVNGGHDCEKQYWSSSKN